MLMPAETMYHIDIDRNTTICIIIKISIGAIKSQTLINNFELRIKTISTKSETSIMWNLLRILLIADVIVLHYYKRIRKELIKSEDLSMMCSNSGKDNA